MWVHVQKQDFYEGLRRMPFPGERLDETGVYALIRARLPVRDVDGVELIPGREGTGRDLAPYWVTGTVGEVNCESHVIGFAQGQELLLVTPMGRFIARTALNTRAEAEAGDRLTLECSFELVADHDWSALELPRDWDGTWLVEQVTRVGAPRHQDYALDLTTI